MKQVWYEWKKLILDKSVLLVVVLSMCIVLGYQWKNADSYAWQYTAVSAKPYIIADLDGAGIFKHLIA